MNLKRLTIEMPEKDHRALKERAVHEGVSMRRYVIDAIAVFMKHGRDYQYRNQGDNT